MAAMIAQGGKAKFSGNLPGSPFASRPGLDGSAEYVGARAGRFGAGGSTGEARNRAGEPSQARRGRSETVETISVSPWQALRAGAIGTPQFPSADSPRGLNGGGWHPS